MTDQRSEGELAALDDDDCFRLLGLRHIGRLGVIVEHYPLIFPVNYGMDDTVLVLRLGSGTPLRAGNHANVTFEIDEIDELRRIGWSVLVRGLLEEVGGSHRPDLVERTHHSGVQPWAPGDRGHWMRLIPHQVSGRRIVPEQLPDLLDTRGYL